METFLPPCAKSVSSESVGGEMMDHQSHLGKKCRRAKRMNNLFRVTLLLVARNELKCGKMPEINVKVFLLYRERT